MSDLTIKTDNKFKPFTYRNEVPAKVLADQFAHLSEEDAFDGFFRYRGYWYHLSDFIAGTIAEGWDAYAADSYFSGVLLKLSKDGESYKVATYYA